MSNGGLGIITEFTYELDKMTYANLSPLKLNIQLAIPPPDGFDVPKGIEGNFTKEQLEEAETEFVKKASSYYSEWFWFPYRSQIWVNCWYAHLAVSFQTLFQRLSASPYIRI